MRETKSQIEADRVSVPLSKKLGIKNGSRLYVKNAPVGYLEWVSPLPEGATILKTVADNMDMIHLFTTRSKDLESYLRSYLSRIKTNGMIWVSWPKKASRVPSDLDEGTIRRVALPLGLVDTKVCAVDTVWSGLKLVKRKDARQ